MIVERTIAVMAKALRKGKDAFRAAKRRDPAVQEAIDRGRATEHDKLVGVLHDLAMAASMSRQCFS